MSAPVPRLALATLLIVAVAPLAGADSLLVDGQPTSSICCLDGASSDPQGAFVLGGSFVFDGPTGTLLSTVGAYMQRTGDGGPAGSTVPGSGTPFGFEVLDDRVLRSCSGESSNSLCSFVFSTAPAAASKDASGFPGTDFLPAQTTSWTLVTAPLDTPVSLVSGNRYWILVSTFFIPSQGSYLLGGRAGTGQLIASFDPALTTYFDAENLARLGADLDPGIDLAIYASAAAPVPEPATLTLAAFGVAGLFWRVSRQAGSARPDRRRNAVL
jgi:hypothetical protein